MNCLPTEISDELIENNFYSIIAYGTAANIALYYVKEMMLNDQSSLLRSLILVNPYTNIDQGLKHQLHTLKESCENTDQGILLSHMIHVKKAIPNQELVFKTWT
jgi:hypothetical protein